GSHATRLVLRPTCQSRRQDLWHLQVLPWARSISPKRLTRSLFLGMMVVSRNMLDTTMTWACYGCCAMSYWR
ncbi:hypothetical protein HBI18_254660, partial [Parastagonospora nodorum]